MSWLVRSDILNRLAAPKSPSPDQNPEAVSHAAAGRRLESWKAIAAYFGRDTRTVQRWERTENLPIHRHSHEKLGTVYAYEAELESWLKARSGQFAGPSTVAVRKLPGKTISIAAGAIVVLASAALFVSRDHLVRPAQETFASIPGRLLANATSEGRSIRWIGVGKRPVSAIASRTRIYVSNQLSGTVSVIDTTRNVVDGEIAVGGEPSAMAMAPDGRTLYVANHIGYVSVVDLAAKNVARSIPAAGPVSDLALAPDGQHLYLATGFSGLQEISLADFSARLLGHVPAPMFLAALSNPLRLYINYQAGGPGGRAGHDSIDILDLPSGRSVGVISGPPNVGGAIAVSPDGSQIWAMGEDACWAQSYDHAGCSSVPGGVVNVFRASDNRLVRTIGLPASSYDQLSFFPDGSRAVLTGGDGVRVLDAMRFATVESLDLKDSGKIAFTSDGQHAYCPFLQRNAVAVFDLAAGRCQPPPTGLVAWWSGDGGAEDARTINTEPAANPVSFAPGLVGQAFRLGDNGRGLLLGPPSWGLAEEMTVAAWIKLLPAATPSRQTAVFDFVASPGAIARGWRVVLDPRAAAGALRLCAIDSVDRGQCRDGAASAAGLRDGIWTHVAVSRTARRIALYVNGNLQTQISAASSPSAANVALHIGEPGRQTDALPALVDEVLWFNRALNASELRSIMQAASAGLCYGQPRDSR